MTSTAPERRYTFREYLDLEASSQRRHEFFDGAVYAMSGGPPDHSRLAANVINILAIQLAGKPCQAFTSDLRVRVLETGLATHPDVSVICGKLERDPEDQNTATNPVLIVVPCHRVVGANGKLTGYAAGLRNKQRLLDLDAGQPSLAIA